MLRTYGFLDTQGRLLSRCCGCLSPIYGVGSTAYRVWSVSPPDSLLHLPQRECCGGGSCTVWLHQRRATGRSSMIQQRPLSRQTPLSWRVRFMEHAIKDKDDELYPGECKAHRERHTGESALQTAALVSQGRFCSGFVWPQDQSLLLTLPNTVMGPLRANLI